MAGRHATRIVHVTTVPESLLFLESIVPYLQQRGCEVVAISSPGPQLADFGARHGIPTVAVPMARAPHPRADLRSLLALTRELRRLRPTIVHSHTPKAGLLGTLAGRIAGVRVRLYHMRGLPLLTAGGARRALLREIERVTCAAATRVICVSPSLRAAALREGIGTADGLVVLAKGSGQGVDAAVRFDPVRMSSAARAAVRARCGIPDDAIVIGFIGRLAREKGIRELTEAFARLAARDPRLHLLLAGQRDARDAIDRATLQTLETHGRAHVLAHDPDAPALYAAMDILALPTYREGFPNVVLEAAAMRVPVVASRVEGCVDAVVDRETGWLVPPRDVDALATALAGYIADPALRARHGVAARERVLREFTRKVICEALYAQYRELVPALPKGP